ncbi:hypothetical protein BH20CHL5_BH20CHL5_06530 [soil metagenome]
MPFPARLTIKVRPVPLDFLKRRGDKSPSDAALAPAPLPEDLEAEEHCAHCGFASAHERAFYCPRCGMRMVRG